MKFGTTQFTFSNNDQVRFVINGNQTEGRMTVTKGGTDLVEFTFNATVQKQVNGVWTTAGASGLITDISITNINKNGDIAESTLTYRQPSYVSSNTMLRLDGAARDHGPPEPPNATPFEFANLHIVHDNRYARGQQHHVDLARRRSNNSLLVEGDYVYL